MACVKFYGKTLVNRKNITTFAPQKQKNEQIKTTKDYVLDT